jgi:hypothetical protein
MKKIVSMAFVVLLGLLFVGSLGFSQIRESGTIHGNVVDESDVALPGVTVSISGPNLIGGQKDVITNQKGYYRFVSLPPGEYKVEAEIAGFTKVVKEGIRLNANMTLTVDFELPQASLQEEVLVTGQSPTIDIKGSSQGSVVMTEELLLTLPKAGLGMVSGNLYYETLSYASGMDESYSAYGGYDRGYANAYQMDGVDISSPIWGTPEFSPDVNIMEEVAIQGLGLPAEYGEYTGTVLTAVTKSGSNTLSGMVDLGFRGNNWNSENRSGIPDADIAFPSIKTEEFSSPQFYEGGFQIGGKVIHDKLWFFASGQYARSVADVLGTDYETTTTSPKSFVKMSYQLNPANRFNLSANYTDREHVHSGGGANVAVEATSILSGRTWVFNGNWTSTLSDNTLLELKLGYYRSQGLQEPASGRRDISGVYDLVTGEKFINSQIYRERRPRTFNANLHLNHYVPDFIGSHDIKIGAELYLKKNYSYSAWNGNALIWYLNGVPYIKQERDPTILTNNIMDWVGFISDRWAINKRLTLNLGVRYNHYWFNVPSRAEEVVYNEGALSPRLGLSYDLFGDRKNVIKFHYGHYYEGLTDQFFGTLADSGAEYVGYQWDGTDWFEYFRTFRGTNIEVDPDVKHPYISEITLGYERELFRDASISVSGYYRQIERTLGQINTAAEYVKRTITNPGPDGIVGTADDLGTMEVYDRTNRGENSYLITNPEKGQTEYILDDPKRNVTGFEIVFTKHYSQRWQMIASYHYKHVEGNVSRVLAGASPNMFVNPSFGPVNMPHSFKIMGSYLIPYIDASLAVRGYYTSGQTYTGTFYVFLPSYRSQLAFNMYPGGEKFYPAKKNLDLSLAKIFRLGETKLELRAEAFNLFNSHDPSYVDWAGSLFGKILGLKNPRTFEIGVRFTY